MACATRRGGLEELHEEVQSGWVGLGWVGLGWVGLGWVGRDGVGGWVR